MASALFSPTRHRLPIFFPSDRGTKGLFPPIMPRISPRFALFHMLFFLMLFLYLRQTADLLTSLTETVMVINFQNFHVVFPETIPLPKKIPGISSRLRLILNQAVVLMV